MIITKLQGGLGNQMFQYAAARSISPDKPVYLDVSFLKTNNQSTDKFTARAFELSIFKNLQGKSLNKVSQYLISKPTIFNHFLKKILQPSFQTIYENDLKTGVPVNEFKRTAIYLDGYFQDKDYVKSIRPQLLKEFTFPDLKNDAKLWFNKISESVNPVSVHVRRGDYLKTAILQYHGILPISYYQKAVNIMSEQFKDAHYFIFSDDIAWCQNNFDFLGNKTTIVDSTPLENWTDMVLMSHCKHHIIANSSFGWWAAWLNVSPNKMVIAPQNWFAGEKSAGNTSNIVPQDWITI